VQLKNNFGALWSNNNFIYFPNQITAKAIDATGMVLRYICNIVSKMKHILIIRGLVCLVLLAVLALGNTPKKVLHNWLADHKDAQSANLTGNGVEIGNSGFPLPTG